MKKQVRYCSWGHCAVAVVLCTISAVRIDMQRCSWTVSVVVQVVTWIPKSQCQYLSIWQCSFGIWLWARSCSSVCDMMELKQRAAGQTDGVQGGMAPRPILTFWSVYTVPWSLTSIYVQLINQKDQSINSCATAEFCAVVYSLTRIS